VAWPRREDHGEGSPLSMSPLYSYRFAYLDSYQDLYSYLLHPSQFLQVRKRSHVGDVKRVLQVPNCCRCCNPTGWSKFIFSLSISSSS
jgi:hypothetical protein